MSQSIFILSVVACFVSFVLVALLRRLRLPTWVVECVVLAAIGILAFVWISTMGGAVLPLLAR